ncbi:VacJ family lipoprotein [Pseudomonas chengduensis]|jgi:phospholipid-binding lipoprotein MlaA|uniref:Phospholipid-binding lipoprotein MlaA n=1 Tax=Ectopseudomonas chengduensis TaxID=489632 RepID=A0A1G6L883_9GAMM|nr:VacJ family lipoprotein [Pseudomonas chengduensis]KQO40999.1 ABC transporter [Pseudomonas sp. Leaf83]MDH1538659.1 VacJ family lipoprotein [Pseudomonas chengduensis]SDC38756.1 phospholipid-binding lipoprotein MlaA [Pseudomonas chengduensis]
MSVTTFASPAARPIMLAMTVLLASGCASNPPPVIDSAGCIATPDYVVNDPAESVNRSIFVVNRALDDYLLAPVARGYRQLPDFAQSGVHNFAANFGEPMVFINDLLQGNPKRSMVTATRFITNSTVGVVGLIDVSSRFGLERHRADFGQTFGVWNIADGPIVELPLFGTSNLRDATGRVLGFAIDPFGSNSDTLDTLGTVSTVSGTVDGRAQRLPMTDALQRQPDYYAALRDTVAERRAQFVAEGKLGAALEASVNCEAEMVDEQN